MEQMLALEIWAAGLALAGAVGWIIGDMRSAAALDHEIGEGAASAEVEREGLFTLIVPPINATQTAPFGDRDGGLGTQAIEPRTMELDRHGTHLRAEIFGAMPPLSELEAATDVIRQENRIWHSPQLGEHLAEFMRTADLGSLEVLENYRLAIASLATPDGAKRKPTVQRSMPSAHAPHDVERRDATLPIVEMADHAPGSGPVSYRATQPNPRQTAARCAG